MSHMRSRKQAVTIAAILLCVGCGGASPTSPGPGPAPSTTVSLSGRIVTTLTDAPVAGATVTIAGKTAGTALDGSWQIDGLARLATLDAEVSAPGYLTRNTRVKTDNGRSDIALDLIRDAAPFSLAFYRQMVRNAHDAPADFAGEPLRRWTKNPNFYIQTLNPKTGTSITASELALIEAAIRSAVPQVGSNLSIGSVSSGLEPKSVADTVSVSFEFNPNGGACASALVGANPGQITLNYERCACSGLAISPETVAHEVGHALGLRHTSGGGIMDNNRVRACTNTAFSAAETYHARIAYARQPGNMDIDRDAASSLGLLQPGQHSAPLVRCYR